MGAVRIITYPDGRRYEGQVSATGRRHGLGVATGGLTRFEGSMFRHAGQWREDVPHGAGEQVASDGDLVVGTWADGVLVRGSVTTRGDGCVYDGELDAHGQRHGHGSLRYSNGDQYIGSFVHGVRHGQGVHTWVNGDRFVGSLANDGTWWCGCGGGAGRALRILFSVSGIVKRA